MHALHSTPQCSLNPPPPQNTHEVNASFLHVEPTTPALVLDSAVQRPGPLDPHRARYPVRGSQCLCSLPLWQGLARRLHSVPRAVYNQRGLFFFGLSAALKGRSPVQRCRLNPVVTDFQPPTPGTCRPSFFGEPPTAVGQLPTAVTEPSSAVSGRLPLLLRSIPVSSVKRDSFLLKDSPKHTWGAAPSPFWAL